MLGQLDADLLGLEQGKELPFLAVVRAGRIAEGGPNATVLLFDQFLIRELLVPPVAPVPSRLGVQPLGERLCQAIG